MITGKTLIELGLKPSSRFKEYLEIANHKLAAGQSWESIKKDILDDAAKEPPPKIKMRTQPLPINLAVAPENELEQQNVEDAKRKIGELSMVPVVTNAALMPDTCPAGSEYASIPVGGAITAGRHILPAAHSADIACSMCATVFESGSSTSTLLNHLSASTLFGPFSRQKGEEIYHPVLDENVWGNQFLKGLEYTAKRFLGTQGDGNHFAYLGTMHVDSKLLESLESVGYYEHVKALSPLKGKTLQTLVTHHGSRKLGADLYKRGMIEAEKETNAIAQGVPKSGYWLNIDGQTGKDYWEALQYIGRWTAANHAIIHDGFLSRAGAEPITRIKNDHNFVWEKDNVFFHGKGATPAWKDEQGRPKLGIIPLNMGREILLVLGGNNEQFLSFAPHGAGRNQSRTDTLKPYIDPATGKADPKKVEEAIKAATAGLEIRWGSGKADISESPFGYKDASKIIDQLQRFELATLIGAVRPRGCMMAGEFPTPWKEQKEAKKKAKETQAEQDMEL